MNVKANKVFPRTVEDVHYDKGMGIAEFTPADAKAFCKRHFPAQYDTFCEEMDAQSETTYFLDFENILSGLEETDAYKTLLAIIANPRHVPTACERGFLACFVFYHHLRSHAILNSMVEFHGEAGIPKFEYFWMLKHAMANTNACYQAVMTFAGYYWTVYRLRGTNRKRVWLEALGSPRTGSK